MPWCPCSLNYDWVNNSRFDDPYVRENNRIGNKCKKYAFSIKHQHMYALDVLVATKEFGTSAVKWYLVISVLSA